MKKIIKTRIRSAYMSRDENDLQIYDLSCPLKQNNYATNFWVETFLCDKKSLNLKGGKRKY